MKWWRGLTIFRAILIVGLVLGIGQIYRSFGHNGDSISPFIRTKHMFYKGFGLHDHEYQALRCGKKALDLWAVASTRRLDHQFRTWHWMWIQKRIHELWPHWLDARNKLDAHAYMANRQGLRILMVPGVLTSTPYAMPSIIQKGGALGDLLQWADLIAAAHLLGHNITLMEDVKRAVSMVRMLYFSDEYQSCDSDSNYDLIFVDYGTLASFSSNLISKIKCRLRIVDAYGTEPAFNNRRYSELHSLPSTLGKMNLNPKQYLTFFPHSPDNTFLGFCVPPVESVTTAKENIALLYGKKPEYFHGRMSFVNDVGKFFEVHSTFPSIGNLRADIENHGHMSGPEYRKLMGKAKVLIGSGLPVESSGALEAIGRGMAFIQPKMTYGDRSVFRNKPTSRRLTSQVPYLEIYVGPPYVYTVDTTDKAAVESVLQNVSKFSLKPFIPREFTMEGMLERMAMIFEKQDFCNTKATIWPPVSEMNVILSESGEDCISTCHDKGMVCEPAYFPVIRLDQFSRNNIRCEETITSRDIYYPAVDIISGKCLTQALPALYSCAGSKSDLKRVCPCRGFIKYQVALCKTCL